MFEKNNFRTIYRPEHFSPYVKLRKVCRRGHIGQCYKLSLVEGRIVLYRTARYCPREFDIRSCPPRYFDARQVECGIILPYFDTIQYRNTY